MALNGVYLTSSFIGITTFFTSLFGDLPKPYTSKVRIYAGLNGETPNSDKYTAKRDGGELHGADGRIGYVQLWNHAGNLLGISGGPTYISSGSYTDITINQLQPQQAPIIDISADSDSICIASVALTYYDGKKRPWLGDWAKACNHEWYYSGVDVGDQESRYALCMWLDSDRSPGKYTVSSFTLRLDAWNDGTKKLNKHPMTDVCTDEYWTAFWKVNMQHKITKREIEHKRSADLSKREPDPQFEGHIVTSVVDTHNATELCLHPTARGPDFVSHFEHKFCDMTTREILPLCEGAVQTDCFDVDSMVIKDGSRKREAKKPYHKTTHW